MRQSAALGDETRHSAALRGDAAEGGIDAVLRTIDHAVKVAGADHVGLGSDFDGISGMAPAGMEDVSKYPALVRGLIELRLHGRGHPQDYGRKSAARVGSAIIRATRPPWSAAL